MSSIDQASLILHPTYFMDVLSLTHLYHAHDVVLEKQDSYTKQTYRNRCYIAAANGKLSLNIPVVHQGKGHSVPYAEILIAQQENWALNHLKSIASAYNSSPFYEYYEADLKQLYQDIPESLYDWNLKTLYFLLEQFQIEKPISFTTVYKDNARADHLVTAKKISKQQLDPYIQVFQEKHGFIQPLSGLDLLFNLGPAAAAYLKDQKV